MSNLKLSQVVFLTDIDFTKLAFDRTNGLDAQARILSNVSGASFEDARTAFEDSAYRLIAKDAEMLRVVHEAFDRFVVCAGNPLQESQWSGAARFLHLVEVFGGDPERHFADACAADTEFWGHVGRDSRLYPDAAELVSFLRHRDIPVIGLTSSDARARLDEGGRIVYDVGYSIRMKHERLRPSGLFDVIPMEDVLVSDPFKKEDMRLWCQRVFPRFDSTRSDRTHWIFVGDTAYDMEASHNAGVGVRIFVVRHADRGVEVLLFATHVVYSLREAKQVIEGMI